MKLTQSIIEALESLNANKLRSGLTILGIVIGVGAVIAMLAVGHGAEATITGSISAIGTNLLFVTSGGSEEIRNPKPLTMSDAAAIADPFRAPSVVAVAPAISGSAVLTANGKKFNASVTGTTPEYLSMRNYTLLEGDFFTEEDRLGRASVVLIGVDVADSLFGRREGLVGETVRINGQPFRIVGVLASKGGGMFGSEDSTIIVPIETARTRVLNRGNRDNVGMILVQVAGPESVTSATDEVTQILRQRHNTPIGADDFSIFSQQDFISAATTITGVLTVFLGGIAGISLLVGGIGIMNIMLVSVTERTREIGLRKALGARKRDILTQFLTESSLLSLLGGVIGIFLGWLLSLLVGLIASRSGTPFTPVIGIDAILLATIFSTAIGLFFGIYPASRAANLEPVEALRYE
jgi:putative ABC transport system permease protein